MRASTTRASLPNANATRATTPTKRARTHRRTAVASPTIVVRDGRDPETTMVGLSRKRREVIEDMTAFAAGELSGLLKDPDTNWQPQDWLPNPESPDFLDQVRGRGKRGNAREGSFIRAGREAFERDATRDARGEVEGRARTMRRADGRERENAVTDERANASRS